MNITDISLNLNNINTQTKVGVAMLDNALELNDTMGSSIVDMMNKSMMEQSVNNNIGSNFDMYIW